MTTEIQQPVSTQGLYKYHDVIGLLSPAGPGFSGPMAVTTGPDGMLYVANRANPNQPDGVRITRCTKDGDFLDQFGVWGEGPGEFIWVTDFAFSPQGEVSVADEHSHLISVFDGERNFSRRFGEQGSGPAELDRPSGLEFGPNGNLYVVDTLNHRVQVLTPEGEYISQWGSLGVGEGQFNRPNGIAVDLDGDIYVCDWMNDRVQVFDQAGSYKDVLVGHSGMSKWGRTFLNANPEIERKLELASQNIELKQRFYRPVSVHVDEDGKVYVADCYRHRVQIYQKL